MKKLDGILLYPEPGAETVEGIPYLPREKALALAREILRLYGEGEPEKAPLRWTAARWWTAACDPHPTSVNWHLARGRDRILCSDEWVPVDGPPDAPVEGSPGTCPRCVNLAGSKDFPILAPAAEAP